MYVDNIRQSSERMREMLNTLLDSFRLDNGKEQPNLSPCRISAITHILETEFMPIAMNKGLTLIVESHTDAVVLTDKERILQIGNNLLSNAIKFTDNGSVSLAADYDNGLLKLIVEDTGTGMTEDEQQRVFGAFERLSNAAAKDGFGLGLSIVQRIVAMLGGTIRLESEKGKGSRFTVEIPMQTAEELPEQTIQAQMRHNHICHDVIAIDNDEVLLLMLKEMYAHEGMHCDTCTNVSVLMELIRKKEYSLLLTDLNMPEISGFELLELLRSSNVGNSKSIPIVVTTASGSCSKEELIGRGFAGCLFKPFSISELMEITDKCALSSILDEKPDFSTLLSYGNESVMLDKLIAETEKEMQAVKDGKSSVSCPLKPKRFYPLKTFNNAPLKSLDRWGYYYFSLFPSVCSHFTDTFSCQLNPVRRMYNTIHNGICYCRASDCIIPIVRWQLRGDDDGLAPMSVLYYIEQDGSFLGIKVHKEEVIQYEQRAPFDSLEFRFQCAFYFCHLKRTHKFRSIRIICPYALLAGFIPHCCGKEALPGTG